MSEKITSTDIKKALAGFHIKDFFITECKTCSTYFPDPQGLLKFDGIAVRKSYTKPCITGYEIKVSRGDFLQDNKWHLYLQYCNEFYFVVPAGLIKKEEIPENVGLIYYYPETGSLKTKRKALFRDIEEPVGVYKYIIFSRFDQERLPFYESRAEYARDYLNDKSEKRQLGSAFGSKMAADLRDAKERLKAVEQYERDVNFAKAVENLTKKHGLGRRWAIDGADEELLKKIDEALGSSYPRELKGVEKRFQSVLDELREIREKHTNKEDANEDD